MNTLISLFVKPQKFASKLKTRKIQYPARAPTLFPTSHLTRSCLIPEVTHTGAMETTLPMISIWIKKTPSQTDQESMLLPWKIHNSANNNWQQASG